MRLYYIRFYYAFSNRLLVLYAYLNTFRAMCEQECYTTEDTVRRTTTTMFDSVFSAKMLCSIKYQAFVICSLSTQDIEIISKKICTVFPVFIVDIHTQSNYTLFNRGVCSMCPRNFYYKLL